MINFELEKWRRKSSGDRSATASPCTQLLLVSSQWSEKAGNPDQSLSAGKENPSAAAVTSHWALTSREPSSQQVSWLWIQARTQSPQMQGKPFSLLFYLPESTKSQRQKQQTSQELKTHHAAELTLLRVAEWPLPIFSSTMTDEEQPDNTLLFQTVASL